MTERQLAPTSEFLHPEQRQHAEPSMIELLTFINHQVSQMRTELSDHMKDETVELARSIAEMMKDAFPDGDPVGHRKFHEATIKKEEAKAAFWTDIGSSVAKWGLFGVLTWLVYVAWAAAVKGPQ